jgi:hypothetical protein
MFLLWRANPAVAKAMAGEGGEWGIRTLGTLSGTHAFQACSLSHSDNSPVQLKVFRLFSNKVLVLKQLPALQFKT